MKPATARLVHIRPVHPERGEPNQSFVEVAFDRGLKSGKYDVALIHPDDAFRFTAEFATATNIAYQVTKQRRQMVERRG